MDARPTTGQHLWLRCGGRRSPVRWKRVEILRTNGNTYWVRDLDTAHEGWAHRDYLRTQLPPGAVLLQETRASTGLFLLSPENWKHTGAT